MCYNCINKGSILCVDCIVFGGEQSYPHYQEAKGWLKNYIYNWLNDHDWYKLDSLQTWGHCGCCGKPINQVLPKDWSWGICEECQDN